MPAFWRGLGYAVPTSHALRALATDQTYCAGPACPTISVVGAGGSTSRVTQYAFVSGFLGATWQQRWDNIGWAALAAGVMLLISVTALRFINHQRR